MNNTKKNEELHEQQDKGKELNNPMNYSGDTTDLSALLSHNPSPANKDYYNKSYGKIWFAIKTRYRICCR